MKITDLTALSVKNLTRRPGRTALTVVGVVVGTCAVIVMISLGIAMSKSNEEMLSSYGDLTQIEVYSYGGGGTVIDDAMLQAFATIPHVVAVTPQVSANLSGTISAERNQRYAVDVNSASVYAMRGDAMPLFGYELMSGDWLNDTEVYPKGKIPVLVCQNTAYSFHDTRRSESSQKYIRNYYDTDEQGNPKTAPFFDIGKAPLTLTLKNDDADNPKTKEYELVVVGVIKTDTAKGWWTATGMVLRMADLKMLTAASRTLTGERGSTPTNYDDIYVKVDDAKNVDDVDTAIQDMGFKGNTNSPTQIRKMMQDQVRQSQMILGGLAAISLLVAALNIANTMTMAIYERTREIGVMKVLGCEIGSIRTMFLVESACIGFLGGMIGAVLSLILSFLLNHVGAIMALLGGGAAAGDAGMGDMGGGMMSAMGGYGSSTVISVVPPWLVLGALIFASAIGLLSGLAPANRAVHISALEAIRHE